MTTQQMIDFALSHWPFVAAMAVFAVIGQTLKTNIFTKKRATLSTVWWWLRATLPLHPVIAGAVLGLLPGVPVGPGPTTAVGRALYFAAAGMASAYFFAAVDRILLRNNLSVEHPSASWPKSSESDSQSRTPPTPPG